jgi:hypothetical protein
VKEQYNNNNNNNNRNKDNRTLSDKKKVTDKQWEGNENVTGL